MMRWLPVNRLSLLASQLLLLACLLQFSGWLPAQTHLPALCLGGALLCLWPMLRALGVMLLMAAALSLSVHHALQARLDPRLEGQLLRLEGQVAALPHRLAFGDRILFHVSDCLPLEMPQAKTRQEQPALAPAASPGCRSLRRVSLAWNPGLDGAVQPEDGGMAASEPADRDSVWPEPGQRWRLQVRLRRPWAAVNPSAFDRELRLLQQQVDAIGRVLARQRLPAQAGGSLADRPAQLLLAIEGWRSALRWHLEKLYASRVATDHGGADGGWDLLGVVIGLSLGDQSAIGAQAWGLFSRTGVSHLMAISGMHVTLLALVVSALCVQLHRLLAQYSRGWLAVWLQRHSRQRLVLLPAVATAFGYALLSGWGVPAQRTCFMLLLAAWLSHAGRCHSVWSPVLLAAALIVLLDPWAVAQAGFWLSFGAVLALIWSARQPLEALPGAGGAGRAGGAGLRQGLYDALRNQWAATVFLTPMAVAFFSTWSVVGPLANAVAIPWVGFVLTPMAIGIMLLAPLWPALAAPCLQLLLLQLDGLLALLRWLDGLPLASLQLPRPGPWVLASALLGAALMLAPRGLRRLRLGLLCMLPMLLAPARTAPADTLVITALDLGQGSMILVEQGKARLLYDTGPARRAGQSAIEQILLPYLHSRGLDSVELLVLSHLDAGHTGGGRLAFERLAPRQVLASADPRLFGLALPASGAGRAVAGGRAPAGTAAAPVFVPCRAGQRLPWADGVIEMLHPAALARNRQQAADDRQSCVIRIRSAAGSVLLAGDLPRSAERTLPGLQDAAAWRADVLVAPRQGSHQGTGERLLAAVRPDWVVLQTGYRNHHGHPHPQWLARVAAQGARLLRTDLHGAVRIELRQGQPPRVERSRLERPPYWRLQPGSGDTPQPGGADGDGRRPGPARAR